MKDNLEKIKLNLLSTLFALYQLQNRGTSVTNKINYFEAQLKQIQLIEKNISAIKGLTENYRRNMGNTKTFKEQSDAINHANGPPTSNTSTNSDENFIGSITSGSESKEVKIEGPITASRTETVIPPTEKRKAQEIAHTGTVQYSTGGGAKKTDIYISDDDIKQKFAKIPPSGNLFTGKIPGKPLRDWAMQLVKQHIEIHGKESLQDFRFRNIKLTADMTTAVALAADYIAKVEYNITPKITVSGIDAEEVIKKYSSKFKEAVQKESSDISKQREEKVLKKAAKTLPAQPAHMGPAGKPK